MGLGLGLGIISTHACSAESQKKGMRCGARSADREAAGDGGAHAACRRGRGCRLVAGHGEERTENMERMVVTLEVSKLSD